MLRRRLTYLLNSIYCPDSSMVEQQAVNLWVLGSNPNWGAISRGGEVVSYQAHNLEFVSSILTSVTNYSVPLFQHLICSKVGESSNILLMYFYKQSKFVLLQLNQVERRTCNALVVGSIPMGSPRKGFYLFCPRKTRIWAISSVGQNVSFARRMSWVRVPYLSTLFKNFVIN